MKRFLLLGFVVFLSTFLTGMLCAESVRIGGGSGSDLLPSSFNPSFNYQATSNSPGRSVDFTVFTADQGTQSAGDTCAMNPSVGAMSAGFQPAQSGGDWAGIDLPSPENDYWGYGWPDQSYLDAGYFLARNAGWMPGWQAQEGWYGPWWDPNDPSDPLNPLTPDGPSTPVVPEPGTMLILGLGLAAGAVPLSRRWRRK